MKFLSRLPKIVHIATAVVMAALALFFTIRHSGIISPEELPPTELMEAFIVLAIINAIACVFIGPKQFVIGIITNIITYLMFFSTIGGKMNTLEQMYIIFVIQVINLAAMIAPQDWREKLQTNN